MGNFQNIPNTPQSDPNRKLKIWRNPQILKHLGYFLHTQTFRKFPRYPCIWEIHHHQIKINIKFPIYPGILKNSQITRAFRNLTRYQCIWEIPKISWKPRHLANFPDTQAFRKFLKYLKYTTIKFQGIWGIVEISPIPRHLGNFANTQAFGKFPDTLAFGKFPKNPGTRKFPKFHKLLLESDGGCKPKCLRF